MKEIRKALVTGGAGFVGSHLVEELISRGIETFVIDNFSTGRPENIGTFKGSNRVHVLKADLNDAALSQLPNPETIDVVFHEAAIASVPKSVTDPELVHSVNVNASLKLMNFCVQTGIRRFVFASSAAVYGVLDEKATESLVCRPASPYGAGKLAVENYLHAYEEAYGLEPVMLRYFNIFGPRQRFSDYSGVITIFIHNLLNGVPLTITGDGTQNRDFVNVKDIVQANILAMESDNAVGEVFNVASGATTTILELADALKEITGKNDILCDFVPARAGDVKHGSASINMIQNVLGYKPRVSLRDGLAELVSKSREAQNNAPQIIEKAGINDRN